MNAQRIAPRSRGRGLWLLPLALATVFAACERQPDVVAPDGVTPQLSNQQTTTVRFIVTRADNGVPVVGATVSVYLNSDRTGAPVDCPRSLTGSPPVVLDGRNCWLKTVDGGIAEIVVPSGTQVGYLARVHPEINLSKLAPRADPEAQFVTPAPNSDLAALTCGSRGPVSFTPGLLLNCVASRFLTVRGPSEVVALPLPVVQSRSVVLKGLNGDPITDEATAYLIEELPQGLPWQTGLATGVYPGFLRFFDRGATPKLPGVGGNIEAYGRIRSPSWDQDIDIAASGVTQNGITAVTLELMPVICANPEDEPNVEFSLVRDKTNDEFSFSNHAIDANNKRLPAAIWAFAAKRPQQLDPTVRGLDKDLATNVVVLHFAQTGGPVTVDISLRHRAANGTQTASVSVVCSAGTCNVASATYSIPSSSLLRPALFQPRADKLVLVTQGISADAETEWSAKASKVSGRKTTLLDQLPEASKSTASSAFIPFSKNVKVCHPDFSFDKTFDIEC